MMSYKERLTQLETILQIDKLSKKYNLKGRTNSSISTSSNGSSDPQLRSPSNSPPPPPNPSDNGSPTTNNNDANPREEDGRTGDDDVAAAAEQPSRDEDAIDLAELKKLVFQGLPGDSEYRPLVWRLLLNYLPPNSIDSWDEYLAKKRNNYRHFVRDLVMGDGGDGCGDASSSVDHPLNPEPESRWQVFFKDNDVLLQIDKDVRRLCPEISFFQSQTPYPNEHIVSGRMDRLHKRVQSCVLESSSVIKKGLGLTKLTSKDGIGTPNQQHQTRYYFQDSSLRSCISDDYDINSSSSEEPRQESHWEVVERILFIYAKLNPGQSYVQGMNEIIGPIYYSLANDQFNLGWREHAEADTFYLFTNLMGEIRDFFIRSLDNSVSGIGRMMSVMMGRLEGRDVGVHGRVVGLGIVPQYYAFRWITLLMSQEFPLPDVLRIWDSLLSDPKRFDFLIDLACAMIIHIRSDLLSGDFPTCMKLLQNYPPIDVRDILRLASSFSESCFGGGDNNNVDGAGDVGEVGGS